MLFKKLGMFLLNCGYDLFTFFRHSSVFSVNSQEKIEGKIVFYYHSIEKGLINDPIRFRFGVLKINKLTRFIKIWLHRGYDPKNSQFIAACSVLFKYCALHAENKIDISDILQGKDFELISSYSDKEVGGVIQYQADTYFKNSAAAFDQFSESRRSVRHFRNELVPESVLNEIVGLTKNAPSVCNRQSINLKFINNRELVQQLLVIQGGLNSLSKSVNQLFVVTSDRNLFVSQSERNQPYIDGGISLMNLLYSLHFKNIAACPLHCSLNFTDEIRVKKLLKLRPSEKIIAFVAIGYPEKSFKVPFSKRREIPEILEVID